MDGQDGNCGSAPAESITVNAITAERPREAVVIYPRLEGSFAGWLQVTWFTLEVSKDTHLEQQEGRSAEGRHPHPHPRAITLTAYRPEPGQRSGEELQEAQPWAAAAHFPPGGGDLFGAVPELSEGDVPTAG